jgi:hypothetical protein
MTEEGIVSYIDHTLLKTVSSWEEIKNPATGRRGTKPPRSVSFLFMYSPFMGSGRKMLFIR